PLRRVFTAYGGMAVWRRPALGARYAATGQCQLCLAAAHASSPEAQWPGWDRAGQWFHVFQPEQRGRHLPAYSPDFNPIEQVFAKLKTALRKAAARMFKGLCTAIGVL